MSCTLEPPDAVCDTGQQIPFLTTVSRPIPLTQCGTQFKPFLAE